MAATEPDSSNATGNSPTGPGNRKPLIEAVDIGVKRGGHWLIRNASVTVRPGQLVFVVGANGAGKSTSVKALLGLIPITEGRIVRGTRRIGYVPQRFQINYTLPITIRRMITLTANHPDEAIDRAFESVGLEKLGNPQVATLSGGELQRLLLARALIERPELLVLDEPEQGLDTKGADDIYKLVRDVRDELDCGVLTVTHDLKLALDMGDDFLVLYPNEAEIEARHRAELAKIRALAKSGAKAP